jgi:hypothetical protein
MDETAKTLLTFAGTAGGSAFLMLLIKGIGKWLSGTAHREQVKNTSLAQQRTDAIAERIAAEKDRDDKVDKAEKERDDADSKRREAEEHVSILKRQVRELGATPLERPDSK